MDNKLSELSKPVAWIDPVELIDLRHGYTGKVTPNKELGYDSPLYSQEYVSALLARTERLDAMLTVSEQALEAADQHIAELEAVKAAAEKLVRCKGRYHSEQNYRALAALFGVTTPDLPPVDGDSEAVIAELRAKLATPVRLPVKYSIKLAGDKSTRAMFSGHNSAINDCADAIRAAGFKVEGDE